MKGGFMDTASNLGTNRKKGLGAIRVSKMKISGRSYKNWMNSLAKAKRSDPSIQRKRKSGEVNGTEPNDSEEDDTTDLDSPVSHIRQERVDFVLRRVKTSSDAEKSNISNDSTRSKLQKRISDNQCNMDGPKLQENFTHSVENAPKSSTTKFVEYWVPVRLSIEQTELYCGSLFSNSVVLCSSFTLYAKETLHKIIVSARKCCDHPKLVDSSMCESLRQRVPDPEKYDAEIKLSSKLLLLHKMLQESSKRGLRVVILYQTLAGTGPISTGHILDDIIHEKFGEDSFVHILGEGLLSKARRQSLVNTYNDKGNGKFICLMSTRACIPSIHLQSVDIVIFFNSDWDPMNDFRALQKIKLDSQLDHVKVFRLYSAYTVEEKLLMLTKQGTSPDANITNLRRSTCHGLLSWGAYYLFEKLDEFHGSTSDGTHPVISDAESFVEDVFLELSNLLPNNEEISRHTESSYIVEVEQIGGLYPGNICLLGEVEYPLMKNYSLIEEMILKEPAYVLWIHLLQGRKPSWKYFSSQSPRPRKCVQYIFEASAQASKKARTRSVNELQSPGEAAASTRREPKLGNSSPTESCSSDEQGQETAHTTSNSRTNGSPSCLNSQPPEASQLQSVKELQRELERLQKRKTELLKQHEDKKLQAKMAREKEVDEINKKYETMLQNADKEFVEERQVLDTAYNKVLAKKSSAEAKLQRESSDLPRAGQHTRLQLSQASPSIRLSASPFDPMLQLSQASSSIHLSASPLDPTDNILVAFSGNIQPSHRMTAPAPHLRHMVRPLPSTPPLPPSNRPEVSFSQVTLQPIAQSQRSRF